MSHAPVRNRTIAALLSFLVAIGGGLVATQAAAADPAPVVTLSPATALDPAVENTITVSGTGFTGAGAASGVYVLLGPAANWAEGTPLPSSGWIAQAWVPSIVDGAFSTTVTAPAGSMDAAGSYIVATSAAHALSQTDRSLDTRTALVLAQPEAEPEPDPDPEPDPEPTPDPVAGITVSPVTDLTDGSTVTITGSYPATVDVAGVAKSTTLYAMYCVDPGDARATGTQCDSTRQKLLSPVALYGGSVPATGTVADGWWTFETRMTVPAGFGDHECLADGDEQCGVFVRLDHTFPGDYSLDSFTPLTFAATPVVPTIAVSKTTGLSPAGETITITGTGFAPNPPATNGTRPPLSGQFGGAYVVFGKFPDSWKPSDGVASSARKVGVQKWVVNPANVAALGSQAVAINPDGSFTLELTVAPGYANEPATGNYGIYTYPGSGAAYAAFETYTPLSFAGATATTTALTADPASGLAEDDSTVLTATVTPAADGTVTFRDGETVLGTAPVVGGTATLTTGPLAAGSHTFAADFVPANALAVSGSTGTLALEVSGATVTNPLTWGVKASFRGYVTGPIAHGAITTTGVGTTDGLFQFGAAEGGTYDSATGTGTAQYSGSVRFTGHAGALDLTLSDPVVRIDSASSATLLVSVNGGEPVEFASLDLAAATRISTETLQTWQGVPATLTDAGTAAFSLGGSAFYPAGTALDPVTFEIVAAPTPEQPDPTSVALSVSPAGGATVGQTVTLTATVSPEVAGTVTFRAGSTVLGTRTVTDDAATASLSYTPAAAGAVTLSAAFAPADEDAYAPSTASRDYTITAPTVAQGSLTWGVKESFRSYVTGGIAQGSISTTGAGYSGGEFVFGQATGGTYSTVSGTGTSNYSGSVRFTGHAGQLDLSLSDPIVRVDSATSGVLLVSINGGPHVPFATLALGSGTFSTPGNAIAWSGVPASLTAQGAAAFSLDGAQFYAAGTALDPVSFVIGSPSSGGGSSIVSAYGGERQPAATPPATTGLTVLDPERVVAGGQITVSGAGFEPDETDILVVIYSTPVVLSRTASADADGVATWTGRLPAGLTGKHTLTLQGSINLGVVLDIPAKVAIAAGGCPVIDADLAWGFKESFRAYISGSIANGEWKVADGATYETPLFGWSGGEGSYDPETAEGLVSFLGSITFTGHGGILNTTVANPQLQFVDDSTAILLLDVSGTTQEGEPVDEKGVAFVELDLSGAVSRDGDVLSITEAPAVLLADGAAAFGTYETGEVFDAITAELTLDPTCAEAPVVEEPVDEQPLASTSGLPWWGWLAIALVLVAIAVAIAVLLVRRRRA